MTYVTITSNLGPNVGKMRYALSSLERDEEIFPDVAKEIFLFIKKATARNPEITFSFSEINERTALRKSYATRRAVKYLLKKKLISVDARFDDSSDEKAVVYGLYNSMLEMARLGRHYIVETLHVQADVRQRDTPQRWKGSVGVHIEKTIFALEHLKELSWTFSGEEPVFWNKDKINFQIRVKDRDTGENVWLKAADGTRIMQYDNLNKPALKSSVEDPYRHEFMIKFYDTIRKGTRLTILFERDEPDTSSCVIYPNANCNKFAFDLLKYKPSEEEKDKQWISCYIIDPDVEDPREVIDEYHFVNPEKEPFKGLVTVTEGKVQNLFIKKRIEDDDQVYALHWEMIAPPFGKNLRLLWKTERDVSTNDMRASSSGNREMVQQREMLAEGE